jgi:hypothetical protein
MEPEPPGVMPERLRLFINVLRLGFCGLVLFIGAAEAAAVDVVVLLCIMAGLFWGPWSIAGDKGPDRRLFPQFVAPGVGGLGSSDDGDVMLATGGSI